MDSYSVDFVPWGVAKSLSQVLPWGVSPHCTVFGKEHKWCASLTHQLYPRIGNPWGWTQSTNQSLVVTTTKNTQRTEPVAVGIGQYVYSITNEVTAVDCCVCRPLFWGTVLCVYAPLFWAIVFRNTGFDINEICLKGCCIIK